jgi:sugar lactone lactonase YvrE
LILTAASFVACELPSDGVTAQETRLHKRISIDYHDVALETVLKDLEAKTGIRVEAGALLKDRAEAVTCTAHDQELGRVLHAILRPRGLKAVLAGKESVRLEAVGDLEELKIKREEVFEFAERPQVTRHGDRVTVRFTTKGFSDASVAIEDADGRILRHLASGVLGQDAPLPFQWNSKQQTLVWDGKDDQGKYVDDKDSVTVRVSLGLKPRFERTLFWSPKKRLSARTLLVQATEPGVLVYDGDVVDHLRLFNHQGDYLRTIYPFPAGELAQVRALRLHNFPQDGRPWPLKEGFFQATLLTSGPNAGTQHADGMPGRAASAMAVGPGRIALADLRLNRLGAHGLPLPGPPTAVTLKPKDFQTPIDVPPLSAAFSPDGKHLYLTAYFWKKPVSYLADFHCLPAVLRMEFAADKGPELFAGSLDVEGQGSDDAHFNVPASVACDAAGRVYVADYVNDRVQVLSPQGRVLRTLRTRKPAQVCIHHKTQQLYVFSWALPNRRTSDVSVKPPTLTRFRPFDDLGQSDQFELPVPNYQDTITTWYGGSHLGYGWGQPLHAALDCWTEEPTIWLSREQTGRGRDSGFAWNPWRDVAVRLLAVRGGNLVETRHFGDDLLREVPRIEPPVFQRQRLYVAPKDGALYVAEGRGYCKSFVQLVKIVPDTGAVSLVDLPFSAEDMAFDLNGHAYLRTNKEVARYDPANWREVPFDYGEQRLAMGYTASGMGLKTAPVQSALGLPAPAGWHHGGMFVSARGHLAVSCYNKVPAPNRAETKEGAAKAFDRAEGYVPPLYPGRARFGEVHVWDAHGKMLREDVVRGVGILNGIGLDRDDHVYLLESRNRVLDGKPYFNSMAGTLMKLSARSKVISTKGAPIALTGDAQPGRAPDLVNGPQGQGWVEGCEWKYGGVGFGGKNPGSGCACWNCRFALDYFGRSFAPEIDHYSVAALDTAGNLILRIGRYGNVDDGRPLKAGGGPPSVRSLGGDEVALFHAAFVGVHTDRRLFIADAGNGRILSVRLGYHAEASVRLKEIPDSLGRTSAYRRENALRLNR